MKKIILKVVLSFIVVVVVVLPNLAISDVTKSESIIGGADWCTGCIYESCSISSYTCVSGCSGSLANGTVSTGAGSRFNYKLEGTYTQPCSGASWCSGINVSELECIECN